MQNSALSSINVNHLRIFETVYKAKSMTLAAQQLFLTQSGISQHIKRLEEGLGRIKADFALCQSIPRRARAPLLTKQPENPYVPRSPRFSLLVK